MTAEKDTILVTTEQYEGGVTITHETCGDVLLYTERVHLDTLDRIAAEHVCPPATTGGGRGV